MTQQRPERDPLYEDLAAAWTQADPVPDGLVERMVLAAALADQPDPEPDLDLDLDLDLEPGAGRALDRLGGSARRGRPGDGVAGVRGRLVAAAGAGQRGL